MFLKKLHYFCQPESEHPKGELTLVITNLRFLNRFKEVIFKDEHSKLFETEYEKKHTYTALLPIYLCSFFWAKR